ncbi:MAG TPA: GntR family transcriptional regulator [Bacilli bacterium]
MEKQLFDISDLQPKTLSTQVELDRRSPVPLYHQLKEILRSQIENGNWKSGDIIPNENLIASDYGLSRGTVREAMDDLVREGLLTRQRGRGTFVAAPKLEQGILSLYSVHEYTKQTGHIPGSQILEFVTEQANKKVKEHLQLSANSEIYKLVRTRLVDGEPIMYDRVYIPASDFPGLSEKDISNVSLYEILSRDYGVVLGKAHQYFEPVLIDQYESQLLKVDKGSPALLIERVTNRMNGTPVVYSKIIIRGDRCRFFAEIPNR